MKKRKVIILVLGLVMLSLGLGGFIGGSLMNTYNEMDNKTESVKKTKSSNGLSMMLETGSNTGVYEQTTRSTWPTEGYLFNSELSKCENGGKLSWNDENNTVIMTGSTSDKCYVYFDVYSLAVINSVAATKTNTSIELTVNVTPGTKPITKYYYSKDSGVTYTESSSNTYTFSGLSKGKGYNIKIYAVDEDGNSSSTYSKAIGTNVTLADLCWDGEQLATCITHLNNYDTVSTNLYNHNSNLVNGANDESYRYAGPSEEVKNFVCFGSYEEPCPTQNLYRIIGVFGNKVKLIKADYATSAQLGTNGDYDGVYSQGSEHYKGNNYSNVAAYFKSSNTWSSALLNTVNLNVNYESFLNTMMNSYGSYSWLDQIDTTTWKVGGNTWVNIGISAMNLAYQNEIVSPAESTTYSAKIGLMYVSDYGYAASPEYWTYKGFGTASTDYRAAKNDNWLYMGLNEWTISRRSDDSNLAFYINSSGFVSHNSTTDSFAIRPVFYINVGLTEKYARIGYYSGLGTINDPFYIRISDGVK